MAGSADVGPRVAIVTGGSRGIGRSIVGRLAGDGYRVVVVYASNEAEANAAVAEAATAGGEAIAIAADVADEAAMAGCSTGPSGISAGSTWWSTRRA